MLNITKIFYIFVILIVTTHCYSFSSSRATKHVKSKSNLLLSMNSQDNLMTCIDIENLATKSNLKLKADIIGPLLTLQAFPINEMNEDKPIGYLQAFIRPLPLGLFHLDTIQVKNRRQTLGFKREGWTINGPGITFIMGAWALCWAYTKGCKKTELLAVMDDEKMHKSLVKLYGSYGFEKLRFVDDSISDRLVWGAVGTLMSMEIIPFLERWTPKLDMMMKQIEIDKLKAKEIEDG